MIILMKCLNEEKCVKRCIGDFHDEEWGKRISVIDGGSTDYTVCELLELEKVEVFIHPWLDWYHNMEVTQSNIALSYVPNGEWAMIVDFDEKLSDELKQELARFNLSPPAEPVDLVNFSRRTYELMRHEDSPYCMYEEDGWPVISHQIGQYPDYQPRLIRKTPYVYWINSPHHVLYGWRDQVFVQADIIHYEKDDGRDRFRIEKQWAQCVARRKSLGLTPDLFDANKKGFEQFRRPDYWHKYWSIRGVG